MAAPKLNTPTESSDLEVIFKESLRILRSRSWAGLGTGLKFAIQELLGQGAEVEVWVHEALVRPGEAELVDSSSYLQAHPLTTAEPTIQLASEKLKAQKGLHIHVQRETSKNPLLWIRITGLSKDTPIPKSFSKVWTALSPSILSACDLVQYIVNEREKSRLENELKTAEIVQRTLIPASEIFLPHLKIAASYRSALECGGDWWGVYRLSETKSLVLIGDVTGHGTASALVSAMIKGYCDAATRRADFNLNTFFEELNQDLYILGRGEICLSFLAIMIDAEKSEIEVMNAGHPTPFQYANQPFALEPLLTTVGPILGFDERLPKELQPKRMKLQKGSHLVVYTDGLTEAVNLDGRVLGEGRLLRALKSLPHDIEITGELIRAQLLQLQADWIYGNRPEDDTTLLVLSF